MYYLLDKFNIKSIDILHIMHIILTMLMSVATPIIVVPFTFYFYELIYTYPLELESLFKQFGLLYIVLF